MELNGRPCVCVQFFGISPLDASVKDDAIRPLSDDKMHRFDIISNQSDLVLGRYKYDFPPHLFSLWFSLSFLFFCSNSSIESNYYLRFSASFGRRSFLLCCVRFWKECDLSGGRLKIASEIARNWFSSFVWFGLIGVCAHFLSFRSGHICFLLRIYHIKRHHILFWHALTHTHTRREGREKNGQKRKLLRSCAHLSLLVCNNSSSFRLQFPLRAMSYTLDADAEGICVV